MEIRESSIPCHKRNLLEQRARSLRSHIMFPVERPSILNTIARGAMGQRIPEGSISMINLLDEKSLDKIAESAGARIWKGFITFGSVSAGVLVVFIILQYGAQSPTSSSILLGQSKRASQPEEQQPAETFPTTEEPRPIPPSTSEKQHPAHKVPNTFNIMDKVKNYNELRKLLDLSN
ncbi:hypothetical protein HN011_011953 [Eciton burchellii]|nr:hypothetical protein HN011_011953 [Eciton burchellii]